MTKKLYTLILYAMLFTAPLSLSAQESRRGGFKSSDLKMRYDGLVSEIKHHDRLYYREHRPEVSDAQYDHLFQELLAIEEKHPEWVTPSSPSQTVGNDLDAEKPASAHYEPMLSIQSIQTGEELSRFYQRVSEELKKETAFSVEEKIDGVAVSLQYESGQLKKALTRGNGAVGNNITNHARQIKSIPLSLKGKVPKLIEIRGEIYLSKENFAALNQKRRTKYRNPRNGAAGLLNTKKPNDKPLALLDFVSHSQGFSSEPIAETQSELLNRFKQWGFATVNAKLCSSLNEIEEIIPNMESERRRLPYEIDGVVIKVNELALGRLLGTTAKAPRSAVAYKFNSETVWTRVKKISFQKGQKGRITPIALLEPILIDGSRVEKVSLLNLRMFNQMDLRTGDQVLIEKRGRIIPKVIQVRPNLNRGPKIKVDSCPICRRKLTSGLYCDWPDCK